MRLFSLLLFFFSALLIGLYLFRAPLTAAVASKAWGAPVALSSLSIGKDYCHLQNLHLSASKKRPHSFSCTSIKSQLSWTSLFSRRLHIQKLSLEELQLNFSLPSSFPKASQASSSHPFLYQIDTLIIESGQVILSPSPAIQTSFRIPRIVLHNFSDAPLQPEEIIDLFLEALIEQISPLEKKLLLRILDAKDFSPHTEVKKIFKGIKKDFDRLFH